MMNGLNDKVVGKLMACVICWWGEDSEAVQLENVEA
jgi:hypothetical protein